MFAWALPLSLLRILSALVSGVSDCDETYNYWEAAHLLSCESWNVGFQTWEYAPNYALRSWAFVVPFGLIGGFLRGRLLLGLASAFAEASLVRVCEARFGTGIEMLVFLMAMPGMFVSSVSLLPSSVCLTLILFHESARLSGAWRRATLFAVAAVLWPGWPFIAVYFLPFFIDTLWTEPFLEIIKVGLSAGIGIGFPVAVTDFFFYGSLTLPLLNVLRYNAVEGGDELYGVEPASYYVKNLALNVTPVILLLFLGGSLSRHALPGGLWLLTLFARPHKEERFTYPAYASIAIVASLAARKLRRVRIVWIGFLVAALFFGVARTAALVNYYGQPQLTVWRSVAELASQRPTNVTICVGKEWYRYPSSYFLPSNARLEFVDDGFHGELPRHWEVSSGSRGSSADVAAHFNDRNMEVTNRYVPLSHCHFIVDLRTDDDDDSSSLYQASSSWTVAHTSPFLDAGRTTGLARAFLVPYYSYRRAVFADYVVLTRTS